MNMIDSAIIAVLMKIAVNLSGYPELPVDQIVTIDVVTSQQLASIMCEQEIPQQKEACFRMAKKTRAVTDRTTKKVYVDTNIGLGISNRDKYSTCIGVHEMVHLLQMASNNANNYDLTVTEWYEAEKEAYYIQLRCQGDING